MKYQTKNIGSIGETLLVMLFGYNITSSARTLFKEIILSVVFVLSFCIYRLQALRLNVKSNNIGLHYAYFLRVQKFFSNLLDSILQGQVMYLLDNSKY